MNEIKEFLETNPVMITSILSSVVGLCGALGIKELLSKAYDRYCKKDDEKDSDHKQVQEIVVKMDEIISRLDEMERKNIEFTTNDMLILEDRLVWMQHKAIERGQVTRECVPRYQLLLKRYHDLNKMTDVGLNEEIEFNHKLIQGMINEGKVAENWKAVV